MHEAPRRPVVRVIVGETEMVHWPSGRITFQDGFWSFVKLAWWAGRNNVELVIEQSTRGKA